MVAIKIRQLLSLRSTSASIIGGGDINHHHMEEDDNDDDIQDSHDDLAASIANRELLLTAAAMKNTNSNNSDDMRLLRDEIKMLRDEMRERFDALEKKNSNVDVSMDSKGIKHEGGILPSHVSKVGKVLGLVSPANKKKAKDDIGGASNTHSINKQNKVLNKVVGMPRFVGKDSNVVDDLLEEDTTEGAVAGEELHVDIVNDEQQTEGLIIAPRPTRVLKMGKRNQSRKQQAKGKRRQKKNKITPASSVSPASIPTTGYHGILTIFVTLINAIPTLLLMRGGKRLYMLLAFIAASYLFKEEMDGFSGILGKDIACDDHGWFSIGSFSFIQGVRALEDCPEQYSANNIDTYGIGSKVTIEEKVYECTESPCGWKIIGTCVGDMFLPSSASAQPTIQTLGMPVHFPSMMPSSLLNNGNDGGSNQVEPDSVVETEDSDPTTNLPTPLLVRVRTHSPMSLGTHSPAAASSPPDDNDAKSPSSSTAATTPQTNPPSVGGEEAATIDNDSTSSTASSNCIDINIVYDAFPEETSWKLYKVNTGGDTKLLQSHQGSLGDPPFTETFCLEDGEYKFVISDSYDGIYPPGLYTVAANNGAVITKGGEFE